jgi:hypothetical protein
MKVRNLARMSAAILTLAGALVANAGSAAAQPTKTDTVAETTATTVSIDVQFFGPRPGTTCTTGWVFGDLWGHTGTFRCGTRVMQVDWTGNGGYEYFGIAPGRTIWHSWASSPGYVVMPNNGRADAMNWAWKYSDGTRRVSVYVSGSGYWCSTDYAGDGYSWKSWVRC